MIEVNLLPGASKKSRKSVRGPGSLGAVGKLSALDRWNALVLGGWIIGPAAIAMLFMGASSRQQELTLAIEQAVQDSIRYARLIETQEKLRARRDTIAQKLELIEEIDAGRYIWAHVMDEVSRALPDYTWLTSLRFLESGSELPDFLISGQTGNTFALTRFMKQLEESPFIRSVRLSNTEQVQTSDNRVVYEFVLTASYEEPPAELIQTVPIFVVQEE